MTQDLSLTGVSISGALRRKGDDWFSECTTHVRILHQVLSVLYEGLESDEDNEEYNTNGNDVFLSAKSEAAKGCPEASLFTLFSQHCYSLIHLCSETTKGPVKLPLVAVMRMLTRCLKVSYADVVALPSMTLLASGIARLHQSCMDVLGQLILCCKRDLLSMGRPIIDLCIQTLTSASKMELSQRSRTKASVYQTLLLWIQTCGWASILSSHAKLLIQDLISNTKIHEDSIKITSDKQDSSSDVIFGKKKKGKKKRTNKGDSYAELEAGNEDSKVNEISSDDIDAVVNSLTFARFAIENLPFSSSQNLVRHITDTAAAVQKRWVDRPRPYHLPEVRKRLYQAVSACALASLDNSCHRNTAVFHFQLTNSALHLLIDADSKEVGEVKLVCSQALKNLELYGNIRGPVIRKVLPDDSNDVEDIAELARERDRLLDDSESLRTRLLESEMENERQSHLIANFQKELTSLRAEVARSKLTCESDKEKLRSSSSSQVLDTNSPGDDDNDEPLETEDDVVNSDEEGERGGREIMENSGKEGNEEVVFKGLDDKKMDNSSLSLDVIKETTEMRDEEVADTNRTVKSNHAKRLNTAEDEKRKEDVKRLKQDPQEDMIEDMLLDFVDAPPDL